MRNPKMYCPFCARLNSNQKIRNFFDDFLLYIILTTLIHIFFRVFIDRSSSSY